MIGAAHTFARRPKFAYASRVPSADRLMVCTFNPVVRRRGSPRGRPEDESRCRYTSRPPAAFDTYSRFPSGVHTGLVFMLTASVTRTASSPLSFPDADTTQIALGATFPAEVREYEKSGLFVTNAIRSPSGDQVIEWTSMPSASSTGSPPATLTSIRWPASSTYASRLKSPDSAAREPALRSGQLL